MKYTPRIFISSSREGLGLARALADELAPDAVVRVWADLAFSSVKLAGESLFELLQESDFAVVLFSIEEAPSFRVESLSRENLMFELGLFTGQLGPARVFVVAPSSPTSKLPSDLVGLSVIGYTEDRNPALAMRPSAERLRKALKQVGSRQGPEPDYRSCFLSYSAQDKAFATQLSDGLTAGGVRCWVDTKDLHIGDSLQEQIEKAVVVHDQFILVLSHASVESEWVKYEVEKAQAIESARGKTFLFPIRIDDAVFQSKDPRWTTFSKSRHIGDFRDWRSPAFFNRAVSSLLRDLMLSTAATRSRARSDA